jgi:2-succinyl-5-enolpyruvyl-6-hydroxy-3-cyclohexene-1-carboxylate synthase
MKKSTAELNEEWAFHLVDQLVLQGVDTFCLSPGSRSTSLVLAIAKHPKAKTMIHYDERGMSFHALGRSKGENKSVVLLVTSGTAVANLFPAIMEAHFSYVPLIVITADRPPELRDCGANQTSDQVKIFQDFIRWQIDLPCPDEQFSLRFLSTSIAQAVYRANHSPKGPVHINCMLREPFLTERKTAFFSMSHVEYEKHDSTLNSSTLEKWSEKLSSVEKGLIIAGYSLPSSSTRFLFQLAEQLKWPVIVDIISPARNFGPAYSFIPHFDALLKADPSLKPQAVLHFGDRVVSKTLQEWLTNCSLEWYALVAEHPYRYDPTHMTTHRFQCDPFLFCEQILPRLPLKAKEDWLLSWKIPSQHIKQSLSFFFSSLNEVTEPGIADFLNTALNDSHALFLANSMPVRDADQFFFPNRTTGPIFSNRGLSGIDGNIATAIGLAQGLKKPVVAVLGDLTFLHDLNSLAQIKQATYPVLFVVINNDGGGIFSFLPISQKKEVFECFWGTPHGLNMQHISKCFSIPYSAPKSRQEWEDSFLTFKERGASCLIELATDRNQNLKLHQEISTMIKNSLCPSLTA